MRAKRKRKFWERVGESVKAEGFWWERVCVCVCQGVCILEGS